MVEDIQGEYLSVLADQTFFNSFINVNTADLKKPDNQKAAPTIQLG